MEFDDIEHVLELMRRHDLSEFELEREGLKLRVRKTNAGYAPLVGPAQLPNMPQAPQLPQAAPPPAAAPAPEALDEPALDLAVVKSPIVGTFYRSPEPGAPSFVEIGDRVKKDQVLCIIEAMKLMNEIEAEHAGTIVEIYAQNGKAVEFGQKLFRIKKA